MVRFQRSALPAAVSCALSTLLVTTPFSASQAQEGVLEEVFITGSFIKGSPTDSALPVDVFDSAYIEASGAMSVGEIVNRLTVSSGAENQSDSFTQGSTQGTTNVNLRGLGLTSTLVLINNKRQTLSGARANDGSVFVDTGTVPVIAIDRIEVLKEGASTAYGSDAVAGVVNFLLHKDFDGLKVDGYFSDTAEDSQTDTRFGVLWGGGNERTRINLAMEYFERDPLNASERPELVDNAVSTLGTTFLPLGAGTVTEGPWAGDFGFLENIPDPNCVENQGILIPQASGARCGFFYGPRFNMVNEETKLTAYGSLTHDFSDTLSFSAELNYTDGEVKDNPQSPSYPILTFPTISPAHPGNPFGVPVIWLGRALGSTFESPLAPRENDTIRAMAELSGALNDRTDWQISLTYSENEYSGFNPDQIQSRLFAALEGRGGASGDQFFNPFDPTGHDPELIDWMTDGERVVRTADQLVLDGVISGDLFEMDSGTVQYAAGFQVMEDGYAVDRNELSITQRDANGVLLPADMVFLGGGIEADESRTSVAAFAEAVLPVTDAIELTLAARYTDLETDSSVDPKVALRWQLTDELVFRASASTSFREPSLAQIFAADTSLQGVADTDPLTNELSSSTAFVRVTSIGSEDLGSEESENYNLGLIWTPTPTIDMRLDYWSVDYTDVITVESAQGKVIADRCGPDIIRIGDCETGALVGVVSNLINASSVETDGIDFEGTWSFAEGWALRGNVSHFLSYEIPTADGGTQDVVGLFNHDNFARSLPETKANIALNYAAGNHSAAAILYYVSDYETTRPVPEGESQDIDSWTTLDLQYAYNFALNDSGNIKLSVGAKNVTDEEPPRVFDGVNLSYDPKHHDPRGRIYYLNASYSF